MTTSPPDWAPDLDHELAQLVRLHHVMKRADYATTFAKPIRRAIDVAYASHFRALIEFFHDGRPKNKPKGTDLIYRHVAGEQSPFLPYGADTIERLDDADKLVGHLSKIRRSRTSDWGSERDWALIWPMIHRLINRSGVSALLPETREALKEAGLPI